MSQYRLTFDEDRHVYEIDGVRVPSVTQVLAEAGLWRPAPGVSQADLDFTRGLGTAVHLATAMDDEGELDEDSVALTVSPYLEAWRRFRSDLKPEILVIEEQVVNPDYRYAGTVDRVVRLQGRTTILDIKTGSPHPSTALQTAAYARCGRIGANRMAVYLTKEGKYKAETHSDQSDWNIFAAALAVVQWQRRNLK